MALAAFGFHCSAGDFDATTETVGRSTNGLDHAGQPARHARRNLGRAARHEAERAGVESGRQTARDRRSDATNWSSSIRRREKSCSASRCPRRQAPGDGTDRPAVFSSRTKRRKLSFTGLVFSPDGSRIYLANVNGDIKVFGVGKDRKISPLFSIPLPPANAPGRTSGNSRRHRRFARRQKNLRRGQSFQPAGRTRRGDREGSADLGCRRRAVRCRAGRT